MKQTYEKNKQRIHLLGLTADLKDGNGKVHHFIDGYEYIEIGGIKWATMNVGAEKETNSGLYFQWGDTKGYKNAFNKCFIWECYKYGDETNLSKYNLIDRLTKLESCDDAATVNMGKSWRMPSNDDYHNLLANTTNKWVTNYQGSGIKGRLFISKEDSSKRLFFPACGYCYKGSIYGTGNISYYWSSTIHGFHEHSAYNLSLDDDYVSWQNFSNRYYGFSIRGLVNC